MWCASVAPATAGAARCHECVGRPAVARDPPHQQWPWPVFTAARWRRTARAVGVARLRCALTAAPTASSPVTEERRLGGTQPYQLELTALM